MTSKNDDSSIANASSGINVPKSSATKFPRIPQGKVKLLAIFDVGRERFPEPSLTFGKRKKRRE
jgi:hypothetical protein